MPSRVQGLPGLNRLSEEERRAFMLSNADKLKQFRTARDQEQAAEILFNNQQFVNKFGKDTFNSLNNGSQAAYEARNNMLKDKIINDEWQRRYSPIGANGERNNNRGLGRDWEKYSTMSTDSKLKVLESDWKTPEQFERDRQEEKAIDKEPTWNPLKAWWRGVKGIRNAFFGEAIDEYKRNSNRNILERIYGEDAKKRGDELAPLWNQARYNPDITGHSDDETKKKFLKEIMPGSYDGNMGIPEFAAYYGDGSRKNISSEMEDFSIDDMRTILAKKAIYEQNMSPDMALKALNDEAKQYIKDHQGWFKQLGLFANDVRISTLSYTMDKVNGIYDASLIARDFIDDKFGGEKPLVWVDDTGNVFHPSEHKIIQQNGRYGYYDENNKFHPAHQERIGRATLHNMGKNFDGSKVSGWKGSLDPDYWTKAEMYGTLEEDEIAQYEKIGSSPYKVAWGPDEDSSIAYEAFKMMSFGIADGISMFIPFGIGAAGKALSTAGKVGTVGRAAGKYIHKAGKALSAQGKYGPFIQGGAGALGIAYAYNRGAFQETLAKNLSDLDERVMDISRSDIINRYNQDSSFKAQIDERINQEASALKQDYMRQVAQEGGKMPNGEEIDAAAITEAKHKVFEELANQRFQERKNTDEYDALQGKAITEAGAAANSTFFPEAVKYGFVNTLGHRKFLFTHPQSLLGKAKSTFKGIEEVAVGEGEKATRRLGFKSSFKTYGDKAKHWGKAIKGQAWGGAWTNGTDDMMVDAAERVAGDSYDRYLDSYENGEPIADVYGFIDGMYSYLSSYMKGLQNSMGQETTWNAAAVGGIGSVVSASPHFANIASIATKSGREAFKRHFGSEVKRDENGFIEKDVEGNPIVKDLPWHSNFLEKVGFFVQNGVLNDYYGAKKDEKAIQEHADMVNNLLDSTHDFEILGDLIAATKGAFSSNSKGETKTMQFVRALRTMESLENLAKDEKDPTILSSVVREAKTLIDRASTLDEDVDKLSQEELTRILGQYYANNPGLAQNEENNKDAISYIAENARLLKSTYEAYKNADKEVQSIEDNMEDSIPKDVRSNMRLNKALTGHWEERVESMRDAIGDPSAKTRFISPENVLPAIGGIKGAEAAIKVYDRQEKEIELAQETQRKNTAKLKRSYEEAQAKAKEAKDSTDEMASLNARATEAMAKALYEDAVMQEEYLLDLLSATQEKRHEIQQALDSHEKGKPVKVLTADEIFALDPITRARMLDRENRNRYTKAQRKEIQKLEDRLLSEVDNGGDAYQKVMDIALLMQRIARNKDAYARMAKNPKAAEVSLESQRVRAARNAYKMINRRNAETAASYIDEVKRSLRNRKGITEDDINDFVYKTLRTLSTEVLDNIDTDGILSSNQKQLIEAKEWARAVSDISSVINKSKRTSEQKLNTLRQVLDNIIESARTVEDIMADLEQAVSDAKDSTDPSAKVAVADLESLLQDLQRLGYQRNKAIIESREEKAKREAEQKSRDEAAKERIEGASNTTTTTKASTNEQGEQVQQKQEGVQKDTEETEAQQPKATKVFNKRDDVIKMVTLDDMIKLYPGLEDSLDTETREMLSKDPSPLHSQVEKDVDTTIDYLNGKLSAREYLKKLNPNEYTDESLKVYSEAGIEETAKEEAANFTPYIRESTQETPVLQKEGQITLTPKISPQALMDGNQDGSTTAGNITTGTKDNPQKGVLTVTNHSDGESSVITFGVQEETSNTPTKTTIKVQPEDYVIPTEKKDEAKKDEPEVKETKTEEKNEKQPEKENSEQEEDTRSKNPLLQNTPYTGVESEHLFTNAEEGVGDEDTTETSESKEGTTTQSPHEKTPFNVESIEKKGGEITLKGTFEGEKEETQVKAKKDFDLSKAVEEHRKSENARMAAEGVETNDENIQSVQLGENNEGVVVSSDSIEQQSQKLNDNGVECAPPDNVDSLLEAETINEQKRQEEAEVAYLAGNALELYDLNKIRAHIAEPRSGREQNDAMSNFFEWLRITNTNLQNIIDEELFQMLKNNEHLKVKFMVTDPSKFRENGTGGKIVATGKDGRKITIPHLMLVIDYTDKVHAVHKKYNNGGVIEINDRGKKKKYLLIGTAGFGNTGDPQYAAKMNSYSKLWWKEYDGHGGIDFVRGLAAEGMSKFFEENPLESFYVRDDIYTEIVPGSLTPGYLVRKYGDMDNSREDSYVPISTLFKDEHNPHKLGWHNIRWMIQERTGFIAPMTDPKSILKLRNWDERAGNTFALIPASNGKKVALYIKPKFLREIWKKDSALKREIEYNLDIIGNPNIPRKNKIEAYMHLSRRLYLSDVENGDTIIIGNDNYNNIDLYKKGNKTPLASFDLKNPNYNIEDFKNTFIENLNPRINITAQTITDRKSLEMYDEAGALDVNAARLATVGSRFSIFPVNDEGKPVGVEEFEGSLPESSYQQPSTERKRHVSYGKGDYYVSDNGVFYYKDGKTPIEDIPANEILLRDLEYNRRIVEGELVPANIEGSTESEYNYYIIDEGKNEVIKVKDRDYRVKVLSEEEALDYIKRYKEQEDSKERDLAAGREIQRDKKAEEMKKKEETSDQALGEGIVMNPQTGLLEQVQPGEAPAEESQTDKEGDTDTTDTSKEEKNKQVYVSPTVKKRMSSAPEATQDFITVLNSKEWGSQVDELIAKKWPDAPDDDTALVKFLKDKGIDTESIGTSEAAMKAWIKTIEDCR